MGALWFVTTMETRVNYRVISGQSKGQPDTGSRGKFSANAGVLPTQGSLALKSEEKSSEDKSFETLLRKEFAAKPVAQARQQKADLYSVFQQSTARVSVEQKAIQALDGYWA